MSRAFVGIGALVIALAAAMGCQGKGSDPSSIVGKWSGVSGGTASALELEFKADGTASMTSKGSTLGGKYTFADRKGQFSFEPNPPPTLNGQPASAGMAPLKPFSLRLSEDGSKLDLVSDIAGVPPVTLTRS